ncbi:MAG: dehydrogenase [Alphaproteobacteria bacterium]|nr:dehydrogenase [Alphaproteobacteria bacterium]
MTRFRIGLSRDILSADGKPSFDPVALKILDDDPLLDREWFGDGTSPVTAADAARYDGICLGAPELRASALAQPDRKLRLVARFGVGLDHCDVPAITAAGILLTNNPEGVRRSVASSAFAFILALAHRIPTMDRLVRTGRWNERMNHLGTGLAGKTLGLIGAGNTGRELFRLIAPFGMRHIACDPFAKAEEVAPLGVSLCDLDTVVSQADFLVIACPLDATTRGMIDARAIRLMKRSAFLVNMARGPIVDEQALYLALKEHRIAGAATDVFEEEPTPVGNPLLALDNIIVAPHAMTYTDEGLRMLAEGGFKSARAFFNRQLPYRICNPNVLETPAMKAWFGR